MSFLKQCVILGIAAAISTCLVVLSVVRWARKGFSKDFWSPKKRLTPPACLTSPTYGRHSYIQLKDVRLHYVEKGDKRNPLMLFLHGFPEFWYSWKHQIKAFSRTHWVVAVDMRGYGESDKPRGAGNYKVSLLVDDVRQLIQALGKDKCVLVAHDWGGSVGWQVAALHPDLVTHYIAMNIPHPLAFAKHLGSSLRQKLYSWYMYYFQMPYIPEWLIGAEDNEICKRIASVGVQPGEDLQEEIEAFKYAYSHPGAWTPPINYYRNIFGSSSSLSRSGLEQKLRVRVPTLLIFGKKDTALDYRMAEMSRDYVDDLQLRLVEDSNHWVQREKPELVNQFMSEFLGFKL